MKSQKQRKYLVITVLLMTLSSLIIPNISGITIEKQKIVNNNVDIITAEKIAYAHVLICEKDSHFIINKVEKVTGFDGSTRWFSVTKIPRFDAEGNIIGTMGISRDVTELKKLEERYSKDMEK